MCLYSGFSVVVVVLVLWLLLLYSICGPEDEPGREYVKVCGLGNVVS